VTLYIFACLLFMCLFSLILYCFFLSLLFLFFIIYPFLYLFGKGKHFYPVAGAIWPACMIREWKSISAGIVRTSVWAELQVISGVLLGEHDSLWNMHHREVLFWQWMSFILCMSAGLQIRCVKLTSIDSSCAISSPNPMFNHL